MTRHLREAHAHIFSLGRALSMPSLAGCRDAAECLAVMRDAAERERVQPAAGWALMVGARLEAWASAGEGPSGWPTLAQIDQATGSIPCVAMSFDHHMVMANSAALRAVGVDRDWPGPPGGIIDRDGSGNPTGLLLETAAWAVWNAAPDLSADQRRSAVLGALRGLAGLGFEEVHDLLGQPWLGPILADLHDAGELPVRVWLYAAVEQLHADAAAARSWSRPGVRLAGGKIFVDGTLNSRTAWMLEPYVEPQAGLQTGTVMNGPAQIESALGLCSSMGLGLAAHAIGDGAVRACLDSAEHVFGSSPTVGRMDGGVPRFRIEHAELIDEADVPRFARLGVVASVQPCHLLADIDALRRYLPHRLDRVLPLRDLIDSGCRPGELLWFGSDAPIVRADPGDSIQAAVYRRRADMIEAASIAPRQAITEQEATRCFGWLES